MGWYDRKVRRVSDLSCGDTRIFLEMEVRRVDCRRCGKVKREQFDFLAVEAQLKRAGTPSPQVIGVDEISIRKTPTYRIVVRDLVRGRPVWFGDNDCVSAWASAPIGTLKH
jgi:hypothetical protein